MEQGNQGDKPQAPTGRWTSPQKPVCYVRLLEPSEGAVALLLARRSSAQGP